MMRLSLTLTLALASLACSTIVPPPTLTPVRGAAPLPGGGTLVTAGGSLVGREFVFSGFGGNAALEHEVAPGIALGLEGSLTAEAHAFSDDGTRLAGRGTAQFSAPDNGPLALRVGLGGGSTSDGLRYGTLDATAIFGERKNGLEPYLAWSVAGSRVLASADATLPAGSTQLYHGPSFGLAYSDGTGFLSAAGTLLHGFAGERDDLVTFEGMVRAGAAF